MTGRQRLLRCVFVRVVCLALLLAGCNTPARADEPATREGDGPEDEALPSPAWARERRGPIGRGRDADVAAMIGQRPPALPRLSWSDGRARDLAGLRGRVVVVRSFTHGCPYCAASMPELDALWRRHRDAGLVVLGVYHPKPRRLGAARAGDLLERAVRRFGVGFPVAADAEWSLVDSWAADASWTSLTWLLDRRGVVRWAHPGGELHRDGGADHVRCREDAATLERAILTLLRD